MKKISKATGILLSLGAALAVAFAGCLNSFALSAQPLTANENKATPIIFAVVIAVVAAAGIIYFIIQHKKKK